jgi:hypothetical protein
MDEPKKGFNSRDNPPKCLMDIVDEAYDMLNDRIDEVRMHQDYRDRYSHNFPEMNAHMDFLKDLRDLLALSENFRDE